MQFLVVFDLGGVLVRLGRGIRHKARREAVPEIDNLLEKYCLGRVTTEDFLQQLSVFYHWEDSSSALEECFIRERILGMQAGAENLLHQLSEKNIPVALLSNINQVIWSHLAQYSVLARCPIKVLSFQHGLMKPQPDIYQVVEKLSGFQKYRILFFDDVPGNVRAARERGWVAHQIGSEFPVREVRHYLNVYGVL